VKLPGTGNLACGVKMKGSQHLWLTGFWQFYHWLGIWGMFFVNSETMDSGWKGFIKK